MIFTSRGDHSLSRSRNGAARSPERDERLPRVPRLPPGSSLRLNVAKPPFIFLFRSLNEKYQKKNDKKQIQHKKSKKFYDQNIPNNFSHGGRLRGMLDCQHTAILKYEKKYIYYFTLALGLLDHCTINNTCVCERPAPMGPRQHSRANAGQHQTDPVNR